MKYGGIEDDAETMIGRLPVLLVYCILYVVVIKKIHLSKAATTMMPPTS